VTETDRAAERLHGFLERLDRLALEDLRLVSLPLPDPDERAALLSEIDRVAADAGRRPLVEVARTKTREAIERAYARHQYDPTWAGLNWGRSLGTTNDRLSLALAAEDAAVASVMSDLLDDDTTAVLTEAFEHAAGMAGSTTTPWLSLNRPNGLGWLVWILLAASAVLIVFTLWLGAGLSIMVIALVAVVAFVSWRRRTA
jgi:hypothetical protein